MLMAINKSDINGTSIEAILPMRFIPPIITTAARERNYSADYKLNRSRIVIKNRGIRAGYFIGLHAAHTYRRQKAEYCRQHTEPALLNTVGYVIKRAAAEAAVLFLLR